jgi:hypothetical protein
MPNICGVIILALNLSPSSTQFRKFLIVYFYVVVMPWELKEIRNISIIIIVIELSVFIKCAISLKVKETKIHE